VISFKEFIKQIKEAELQEPQELTELLIEHAKASEGNLEDYRAVDFNSKKVNYDIISVISNTVLKLSWEKIGSIKTTLNTLDIYRNKITEENYIVIANELLDDDTTRHTIVTRIDLVSEDKIGKKLNLKNLYRISEVITIPEKRGEGISRELYKFFVKTLKYTLLGDSEQYFGARKLWARLSKQNDILVDIVDVASGTYLERSTRIHHGDLDGDFDKSIWISDDSKYNIRLILKDIL